MSILIYGQNERLLSWACARIGISSFRSDAQAIGLERNGELVAVTVFDTFSSRECCMHIASDGSRHWLTRTFLLESFAYPFVQCGLVRVMSPIAESNRKALRFNLKLGFQQEGYHPYAAPDGGAMITTAMLRVHCVFIPQTDRHMRTRDHG